MSTPAQLAYFDCFSGASGDMILGALVDAGLALDDLRQALDGLNLPGEFDLRVEAVQRGALRASQMHVTTRAAPEARRLADITKLLAASRLDRGIRAKSLRIFQRLAEAEARVHGTTIEQVHFHEVGAIDAIVDIVGAVAGLERLGVEAVYASALPLGGGEVATSHGLLPLPAPATLELLAQANTPTRPGPAGVELVTPTGAAILTALAQFEQPAMRVRRVGYGAGGRDLAWPNALRLWLGEALGAAPAPSPAVTVLETNVDDMNPEFYGHVAEQLFAAGALDVYLAPIYMKKGRPATLLSVIGRPADEAALAAVLLRETSTLGVRVHLAARYEAGREVRQVTTPYGPISVKLKLLDGRAASVAPEYDACRAAAAAQNVPLAEVYQAALAAGRAWLSD